MASDKRVQNLLSHPDALGAESHLRIPKPLKWEALLVAAAQQKDLSQVQSEGLEMVVDRYKRVNKAAYEAQVKKWGTFDHPTHGRKGRG